MVENSSGGFFFSFSRCVSIDVVWDLHLWLINISQIFISGSCCWKINKQGSWNKDVLNGFFPKLINIPPCLFWTWQFILFIELLNVKQVDYHNYRLTLKVTRLTWLINKYSRKMWISDVTIMPKLHQYFLMESGKSWDG